MTTITPCILISNYNYSKIPHNSIRKLSIILASDDPASVRYANRILKASDKANVAVRIINLFDNPTEEDFRNTILEERDNADGIMVMQPIPSEFRKYLDLIPPEKDVDCATSGAIGRIVTHSAELVPPTVGAILDILEYNNIQTEGKTVLIINRSNIIGKPLALALSSKKYNATPIIANSHSPLASLLRIADIVVTAVGKPRIFGASDFHKGQIVIDAGTSIVDGKVVGDVDTEAVAEVLGDKGRITPVPNGVGSVTVSHLLWNLWATDYMPESND